MKSAIVIAVAILAAPLAAQPLSLAGVSDHETTIRSGLILDFQRVNGDVLFVRDRLNKWYRLKLNRNCIAGHDVGRHAAFEPRDISGHINKLTRVVFTEHGISCNIDSIRRSVAPPQVDSKSPITLD